MPPNPERQARLRAQREAFANDPEMQEAQRNASAAILGNAAVPIQPPAAEPAPAPRPMLPNFYATGGKVDDPLRDAVERNTNKQGLELIEKDLDKPQLKRPSSDQYMREHGYPQPWSAPKFASGGMVKHGSSTRITCKSKG